MRELLVASDGVKDAPDLPTMIVLSCQSFVSAFANPLPTPELCQMTDALNMNRRSELQGPRLVFRSFGSGYELAMSIPGSPSLMHLLQVTMDSRLQLSANRRFRATTIPLYCPVAPSSVVGTSA
ncbi:MAG: hypothetical protein NTY02_12590 [Acidobacteria bacterium]|nr:hypothetical protein [Acidobacteriota bacterium]